MTAGGIVAVVLGLVLAWVLIVPAADWLAGHDVGSAKGQLQLLQMARDAARGRLLTLGAGVLAAAALAFTALNFNLLRRNSERTDEWQRRTFEQAERGQVTDRYTKAIDQLGSSTVDVTIGGIYALERIARDSSDNHPTVMEVLAACIRENSIKPLREPADGSAGKPESVIRPDTQAAITVIGRRDVTHDGRTIDLRRVHLPHADLRALTFSQVELADANFAGAYLPGVDLSHSDLTRTNFSGATIVGADLAGASLQEADLEGAILTGADLTGAKLDHAKLPSAQLAFANLTSAVLTAAVLTDADLTSADLTSADLTGADLTAARWPADTPVPNGWKLVDTSTGRLERANPGSGLPGPS